MSKAGRLAELDRAKGLGILLVVLGHVSGREIPVEWYGHVKQGIYAFHMPLFFFLSGLTFGMGRLAQSGEGSWIGFVSSRARRLIPAYVGMACLVFAGKWAASQFVDIHKAPTSPWDFLAVFTTPTLSFCGFLWYVYALFLALVLASLFAKLAGRKGAPLFLALSVVLYLFFEWPFYFELQRTVEGLPWLASGWLVASHYPVCKQWFAKGWWLFGGLFAWIMFTYLAAGPALMPAPVQRILICATAIPFIYGVVSLVPDARGRVMEVLGKYSFTIYLFNVPVIGLVTALLTMIGLQSGYVTLQLLALTVLASVLPILLFKVVERISPPVAAYIK